VAPHRGHAPLYSAAVRRAWILSAFVVLAASGCGGSNIPSAPVGLGVPDGYRATHVWDANLTGQAAADVIVASAGPPVTPLGFHSADIRVLTWDPLAHQWSVSFDAQKVQPNVPFSDPSTSNSPPGLYLQNPSPTPLLDPKADVTLGPVRAVQLLGDDDQLAFSAAMNYGGSGVPAVLAVVDFEHGLANVAYAWNGEGLRSWRVADRVLDARAEYWTPTDAHCCAVTSYAFSMAERKGYLEQTRDSRPWLGAIVQQADTTAGLAGSLRVTGFADKAPASGKLHAGDVILDVADAPKPPKGFPPDTFSIFDKIALMHPGQVAQLEVERGGARLTVPVRLGSMRSSGGTFLPKTDYTYAAL
jgi:hypothetical protein